MISDILSDAIIPKFTERLERELANPPPEAREGGFKCPDCNSTKTSIINSRLKTNGVHHYRMRRRECECGKRFTTYEISFSDYRELTKNKPDVDSVIITPKELTTLRTLIQKITTPPA